MSLRKFSLVSLAILLVACSGPAIRRDQHGKMTREMSRDYFTGVKKRVALLSFFNEAPYGGEDLGIAATEELRMELAKSGEFIIDPMVHKSFGSSKEIYSGGGSKLGLISREAKTTGVNFIVFGRVVDARIRERSDEIGLIRQTKAYTESKIEIRIFDANANKEIYTETLEGYADDTTFRFYQSDRESQLEYRQELLRYAVKVAARKGIPAIVQIASKMDWVGRVAKIIGTKVYVNAGRKSGMQIGDILKVMTEGQDIYDPETGALLGVSRGEVKGTVEIIDYFGEDGSIAVLHSGGSVLEGDFVQLY